MERAVNVGVDALSVFLFSAFDSDPQNGLRLNPHHFAIIDSWILSDAQSHRRSEYCLSLFLL